MSVLGVRNLALSCESRRMGFRGIFQPDLEDTSIYINQFTFCFWSIHAVHLTVYPCLSAHPNRYPLWVRHPFFVVTGSS
jgi:hypothetical protein